MNMSTVAKGRTTVARDLRARPAERATITITTTPGELREGLFGQILLYIMEVLPRLHEEGIFPRWQIRSLKYGAPPDYLVVPGVIETNYAEPAGEGTEMTFGDVRKMYIQVLGDDWAYMNRLWNTYFRIPDRIVARADAFGPLDGALGVHYRGTDKNREVGQTNPVSHEDMLILVEDFLRAHPEIDTLLVATDEPAFIRRMETAFGNRTVLNTGEVAFFQDTSDETANPAKADHALLDCLLLSRCRTLIKCQSALSGFAKVLNPRLEAYRVSANKMTVDIPYFPDAYIPRLVSRNPECRAILERLFRGDWLDDRKSRERFGRPFRTMERPGPTRIDRLLKKFRLKSLPL
jgi:hypothetical protein